jgi:hypothetical protein
MQVTKNMTAYNQTKIMANVFALATGLTGLSMLAKAFVITTIDGATTTRACYSTPYAHEVRNAKGRIAELACSGAAATIQVVEHISSKTFSTDGNGSIKAG